jgi:galactokinase
MMGGGFGGSVIALVPADTEGLREAIAAEYARLAAAPVRHRPRRRGRLL